MGKDGLDEVMDQGDEFAKGGKFQEAEAEYRRAIKIDKKYAHAWFNPRRTVRRRPYRRGQKPVCLRLRC